MLGLIKKVFGTKHEREIKRMQPAIDAIAKLEPKLKKLSDAELKAKTADFKQRLENGASLDDLLIESFAVVRETGRRVLGMRHYDVQLIGGMVLHQGKIAEMRTGEGKTLVATLPCYLNALEGKGVHVVTVNDYLARRDAEWMGQVHRFLGLEVGCVYPNMARNQKTAAYQADITYGQNNEFGFDYMRDNMKFSIAEYVQRGLNYAIIDEVDSILIDEARTPLIISGPGEKPSENYARITELIPKLRRDEHFEVDEKARRVSLTDRGMHYVEELMQERGILPDGSGLYDPRNLATLHILDQCLRAHMAYTRDQHYMVHNGEVLIIDEFTGRVLAGRRWSDGLHQAVEAKERVPIKDENVTLATISFQNLFRLYRKLSGMTGTADTEATEFHKIYELDVVVIPTNKPVIREDDDDEVYRTEREKFIAVAQDIEAENKKGRPVLVGTTSVEKSDALSGLLRKRNIAHEVLNAKQHEREAYIVAQAGTRGAVTVATNMAGRGTDILLGGNPEMLAEMEVLKNADEELLQDKEALQEAIDATTKQFEKLCGEERKAIKNLGGLHIVGTERHESRRIDNQLRGRAGRQGDPGSSRFFLSLEDDLMRIFGGDRVKDMMGRLGMQEGEPIVHRMVTKVVENSQKKVEERNFDSRKNMLEYDDVMNQQRKAVYALRRQVLQGQYRDIPTEEQYKAGIEPPPKVTKVDRDLLERAKPILEQMVKIHGATLPPAGVTQEELQEFQKRALAATIGSIKEVRSEPIARDVYSWFGCVLELGNKPKSGREMIEILEREVGLSLTEQKERLFDEVELLVWNMVQKHCPEGKHIDDWDMKSLKKDFKNQFGIKAGVSTGDYAERIALAKKLYTDAEAILKRKMEEFKPEAFLRLFRNEYLKQIDGEWIKHLQSMQQLRDGIGLRGYGQRDPKKEYKREGYDLFTETLNRVKSQVVERMFKVERVREEDLKRMEEERRKAAEARQKLADAAQAAQEPISTGKESSRQTAARSAARASGQGSASAGQTMSQGQAQPAQRQGQAPNAQQSAQPQKPMNRAQRRAMERKQRKQNKNKRP